MPAATIETIQNTISQSVGHNTRGFRGALLFALLWSDVVAGSGESDPCEFTGFDLASMGQIKKCRSNKILKIVVAGEFGLASDAGVHDIVVDGGKNCDKRSRALDLSGRVCLSWQSSNTRSIGLGRHREARGHRRIASGLMPMRMCFNRPVPN
jgi:hypothetical protein